MLEIHYFALEGDEEEEHTHLKFERFLFFNAVKIWMSSGFYAAFYLKFRQHCLLLVRFTEALPIIDSNLALPNAPFPTLV